MLALDRYMFQMVLLALLLSNVLKKNSRKKAIRVEKIIEAFTEHLNISLTVKIYNPLPPKLVSKEDDTTVEFSSKDLNSWSF